MGTKPYCGDCPDPEACHQGASCEFVRQVDAYFNHLDALLTGRGKTIMANTSSSKITVTPADVAEQAKEDKLVTEVPAQGVKDEKTTGEKVKEVIEEQNTGDAQSDEKKTIKDRFAALVQKAKDNKQFFLGVVTGAVGTIVVASIATAKKVEEVVELTIADEPDVEDDTTGDETAI